MRAPTQPRDLTLDATHGGSKTATDTPVSGDMVAGTLQYMAPEQLLSDPIDARSDIYSMGIVMYRWVTAELPFDSGATLGLFAHHIGSLPPPPSWLVDEMHPGLEKVMLACMRKNRVGCGNQIEPNQAA